MANYILQLLGDVTFLLALCLGLLVLWSPVILLVLYIGFSICGKRKSLENWLMKAGFIGRDLPRNSYTHEYSSRESIATGNSFSSSVNSDLKWLSDIHNSPEYCSNPSNSSYNSIGPGSWNN